ncbi:MAG: ABC transporter permease subunit [Rhodospirillaceae bacterium]|jgi:thiamine transport system permease protein|nr:ABC transporter permease subunit [Rhodospirillaceae bacterium]
MNFSWLRRSPASSLPGLVAGLSLIILAVSVFAVIYSEGAGQGLTVDWAPVLSVLKMTFFQAGLSTLLSMTLGLTLAWSLSHQRVFPGRGFLVSLLSVSMVMPTLVAVLGLVSVFGRKGWLSQLADLFGGPGPGTFVYGLTGILLAHVFLNAPFVARALLQRLDRLPPDRLKLSASLGLSPWRQFCIVEWPAVKTSFYALSATVFLLCFTSFAIVLTLGGSPAFNTLEVAIYEAVKLEFDLARAVTLAMVQVLVCAGLVVLASSLRNDDGSLGVVSRVSLWPAPVGARVLQVVTIAIFALFYISPFLAVLWDGALADFGRLLHEAAFHKALVSSLCLATLSSALTVAMALAIGGTKRTLGSPLRVELNWGSRTLSSLLSFSGAIYLAVPSLVLGFGFFLIARKLTADVYLLAPVALLLANCLIALPFALVILAPAMEKSALRYDRLAFALGVRGLARWRLVEWPGLRREIGLVAALSFCFSLGDLGVIALFGNRDFATLPWLLYQKIGSYRTDDAAGIALLLLGLTLAVFFLVPKFFDRGGDA